jgi:hypothetical protein
MRKGQKKDECRINLLCICPREDEILADHVEDGVQAMDIILVL